MCPFLKEREREKKKGGGEEGRGREGQEQTKIILLGTNLLNNQQVAIKFEPRKSDAPQLRDEYKTYKILAGAGLNKSFFCPPWIDRAPDNLFCIY